MSFNNVGTWLNDAGSLALPSTVKILIGNKVDLEDQRDITYQEAETFAADNDVQNAWNAENSKNAKKCNTFKKFQKSRQVLIWNSIIEIRIDAFRESFYRQSVLLNGKTLSSRQKSWFRPYFLNNLLSICFYDFLKARRKQAKTYKKPSMKWCNQFWTKYLMEV